MNNASANLQLGNTALNRGLSIFAEYNLGISRDKSIWKGLRGADKRELRGSLQPGEFAMSDFAGGHILHAVKPNAEQMGKHFKSLSSVTKCVRDLFNNILRYAKVGGFYKVWMQLASVLGIDVGVLSERCGVTQA